MTTTIVTPPAEILFQKTERVADPTSSEAFAVAAEMFQVLADLPDAAAVAAPQIGSPLRGFAYRDRDECKVLWNPEIVSFSRRIEFGWEGCLSFGDLLFWVPRHRSVRVIGVDIVGEPVDISAHAFQARLFQHEIDHLEGRLVDAVAVRTRRRQT